MGLYGCGNHAGSDAQMSWLASVDLQTQDGKWITMSAVHDARLPAWKWLEHLVWKCYRKGIRTRSPKVEKLAVRRVDPGQFEFLRGNEACAREWQDGWRE